jgi:hypothetical protein
MKKIFLPVFILSSLFSVAQTTEKKPMKVPKFAAKQDKLILNLNWDNWLKLPDDVKTKGFRSRGFSFLLMNEKILGQGHSAVAFGLGFSSQNVHSNAVPVLNADSSKTLLAPITTDYDLNKLSVNYIDAAFELRFRTSENASHKQFKFTVGIKGGVLVQSHTKYEDDRGKIKTYHIKNLNDFQYGLTGRIGYGHWGISGYYSLMNLFEKGKGPDVVPVSIGLSFAL